MFKKRFLTFILSICFILPAIFIFTACGGNPQSLSNTPSNVPTQLYTNCVTSLNTAINNLKNNTNDVLSRFSIHTYSYEERTEEFFDLHFESERKNDPLFGNVYFATYIMEYNGKFLKHYSRYGTDYKVIDTYVKLEDGTYVKRNTTSAENLTLIERQMVPFYRTHDLRFKEEEILSYYALDDDTFEINVKVQEADNYAFNYTVIKYTVRNDKIIDIETNSFDSHGMDDDPSYMYVINYYAINDAYEEYMNAYNANK